jgi:predicted AAA+ superfamily ATPase
MNYTTLLAEQQTFFQRKFLARPRYYQRLKSMLETEQIIVVQGQRRVGKSSIVIGYLQSLHLPANKVFFFNKEADYQNHIKSNIELGELYETFKQEYGEPEYIFIDEIQDIKEWERVIRALSAMKKYKIIISGSNAQLLSTELTTYLTGRYLPLEVFPLDYCEFLTFSQKEHSTEMFNQYMRRGGMPELLRFSEDADKENYLKTLVSTILLKDIINRFSIREPLYLEKILNYLADTIGSKISLKNIQDSAEKYGRNTPSLNTLSTYISYLELPYLLFKVERLDLHGRRILEFNEKFYFNDLGLRNTLRLHMEMNLGMLLENMVYLHLRKLGYQVYVGTL